MRPTPQRAAVSTHCCCSAVNKSRGKYECWPKPHHHIKPLDAVTINAVWHWASYLVAWRCQLSFDCPDILLRWINMFKYLNKYQISSHPIWWRFLLDVSFCFIAQLSWSIMFCNILYIKVAVYPTIWGWKCRHSVYNDQKAIVTEKNTPSACYFWRPLTVYFKYAEVYFKM